MQIIFSAVDDSKEGILGNTLSRFSAGNLCLSEGHLGGTLFPYSCSLGIILPAALQGLKHAALDLASQLTGVLKQSNKINAAKMLIVL